MSFPQIPPDDPYGLNDATRLRKLANALRGQAEQPPPQGSMVSGRFVPVSWAQHLDTLAGALGSTMMDRKATAAEIKSAKAIKDARDSWASSLPQAMAARTVAVPSDDEDMPIRQEPAKPLTTEAVLKHAMSGMNIPGNEKAASVYATGALAGLSREDVQAERREAARLASIEARQKQQNDLEAKLEMARLRSEDQRYSADQRAEAARLQRELTAEIARGNQELRRLQIKTNASASKAKAEEKAAKLSAKEQSDLDAWEASKTGLAAAIEGLKKADAKGTGWAAGVAQNVVPGGQALVARYRDPAMNAAVQQLTYWTDAIRHERFGSALTATEKASAMQYLPSEYDDKDELIRKAAGLQKIIEDNNRRLSLKGGPRPEKSGGGTPTAPTSAAPPVTRVINGKTYVQMNGQWYEQ